MRQCSRSHHGQHQVGDVGPEHDYVGDKDVGSGDPGSSLTRQPEPPALVLNEPSCYHFRMLDPLRVRESLRDQRRGNNRPLFPHLSVAAR
jgi:hypothetical protein